MTLLAFLFTALFLFFSWVQRHYRRRLREAGLR